MGSRPLDMHQKGLGELLGARSFVEHGCLVAEADAVDGARGIGLDFPSVGATENILMASVLAEGGRTVISNAAREPEIVDICNMLVKMGTRIEGGPVRRRSPSRA